MNAHVRDRRHHRVVSSLELFYDLVFVGAAAVLGHLVTPETSALTQGWVLLAAGSLFVVWLSTSLVFNSHPMPDQPIQGLSNTVRTLIIFVQMAALLACTLAVQQEGGLPNSVGLAAYGLAALTLGVLLAASEERRPPRGPVSGRARLLFFSSAAILLISAPFSDNGPVATGAFGAGMILQIVAVVMILLDPERPVRAEHLDERLCLVILIVTGEAFLSLATGLSHRPGVDNLPIFFFALSFPIAVFIMYFGPAAPARGQQPRLLPWLLFQFLLVYSVAATGSGLAERASDNELLSTQSSQVLVAERLTLVLVGMALVGLISASPRTSIPFVYFIASALMIGVSLLAWLRDIDGRTAVIAEISVFLTAAVAAAALGVRRPAPPLVAGDASAQI